MPGLLPKRFASFILDLREDLQQKLEEALEGRPWVFGFADVRKQVQSFSRKVLWLIETLVLVAWLSGLTSVFGWRTFPELFLIYGWRVTTFLG